MYNVIFTRIFEDMKIAMPFNTVEIGWKHYIRNCWLYKAAEKNCNDTIQSRQILNIMHFTPRFKLVEIYVILLAGLLALSAFHNTCPTRFHLCPRRNNLYLTIHRPDSEIWRLYMSYSIIPQNSTITHTTFIFETYFNTGTLLLNVLISKCY